MPKRIIRRPAALAATVTQKMFLVVARGRPRVTRLIFWLFMLAGAGAPLLSAPATAQRIPPRTPAEEQALAEKIDDFAQRVLAASRLKCLPYETWDQFSREGVQINYDLLYPARSDRKTVDFIKIHGVSLDRMRKLRPCPQSANSLILPNLFDPTSLYIGVSGVHSTAKLGITETLDATGEVTHSFSDSGTSGGVGLTVGFGPVPLGTMGAFLTPFVQFDFLNQTLNHDFTGGALIGEKINTVITGGLQGGVSVAPGLRIYGLAGVAEVNKKFTINLGGPVTEDDQWLLGGTLGGGGSYRIPGTQFNVFAEYQHIWVDTAHIRMPVASPAFNYTFENNLDLVRGGVTVPLDGIIRYSDARLKHDIHLIGYADNGLALYRYRYLWSDTEYVGVMAQEVAILNPMAVVQGSDGFLRVDYGRLGLRLMTWDEWSRTH